MKTTIFITLSILYFSTLYAQDKAKEKEVIRQEFQDINRDSSLKKVMLNNEEFLKEMPDGGDRLTGFYKNGELRKLVSWIGLSNGTEVFEYYFKKNQLIFVYEQFNSFVYDDKKDTMRFDTTERTFEGRYYFTGNKLIDYVTTGHNRFEDDAKGPEKILLAEAAEKKRLLATSTKGRKYLSGQHP